MNLHTIELPAMFYDDHTERMSDKDPADPAYSDKVIRRKARTVVIEACDEALAEIESDADYYASLKAGVDTDRDEFGRIRSAVATIKRIKAYRAVLKANAMVRSYGEQHAAL